MLSLCLLVLLVDLVIHGIYTRLVLRVFETKPLFSVATVPPDPTAELVSFVTDDGVTLRGGIHRSPQQPARGVVLFCPELEGNHWSASIYARGLLDAGFTVVSFDFRNQGESDAQPGYAPLHWPTTCEVSDVRAAMRFIASREDLSELPLGVMGVSRGASAALIAAAESSHVKAVFCEGAYSTDAMLVHFIHRWASLYMPRFLTYYLPKWHVKVTSKCVRWTSQLLRRRNYVVLERWLPKLKNRSVLLVAGGRDNYVHPDIGRHLQRRIASPDVQFWLVPAAKHNRARDVSPAEYDRRLQLFFGQTLAANSA